MHPQFDHPADMLRYVRQIGALGGSLTLRYNEGTFELSGDELIFAAEDYDMGSSFEIVPTPLPAELSGPIEDATLPPLSNALKTLAMGLVLVAFIGVGLMLAL